MVARTTFVIFSATIAIACADRDQPPSSAQTTTVSGASPCTPAPGAAPASPDTMVIRDSVYSCTITVSPAGVELLPDSTGARPDPAFPVTRATDGRYYTAAGAERGRVLVWKSDGSFDHAFGRAGNGPGEFAGPYLGLFAGPNGDIYVRSVGRWSVFSSDGTLRHSMTSALAGSPNQVAILDDGAIVSSRPAGGFAFNVARPGTDRVQSFNPIAPPEPGQDEPRAQDGLRKIAAAGGSLFWAAPVLGDGRGYTLDLWDTTGTIRRTIRREVAWYPPGGDVPGKASTDQRARGFRWAGGRPPNHITAIAVDDGGLLFVVSTVTLDSWRLELVPSSVPGEGGRTAWTEKYDTTHFATRLEVIDPVRAIVLASAIVSPAYDQFPRSRMGYETRVDADGAFIARIVQYVMVPRH